MVSYHVTYVMYVWRLLLAVCCITLPPRTSVFLQNCPYCSDSDSSVKHFPPCSQITAATTHRLIAHNSKEDTFHTAQQLLGYHLECDNDRHHYTRELVTPTEPSNRAFLGLREFYPIGNSRNLCKPYGSVAL